MDDTTSEDKDTGNDSDSSKSKKGPKRIKTVTLKQLHDLGVDISSGRLSQFITDGLDVFHDEKDQLLQAGLSV